MAFQQSVMREHAPALLALLNTPPDSSDRYAVPAARGCVLACIEGWGEGLGGVEPGGGNV